MDFQAPIPWTSYVAFALFMLLATATWDISRRKPAHLFLGKASLWASMSVMFIALAMNEILSLHDKLMVLLANEFMDTAIYIVYCLLLLVFFVDIVLQAKEDFKKDMQVLSLFITSTFFVICTMILYKLDIEVLHVLSMNFKMFTQIIMISFLVSYKDFIAKDK